MGVPRGWLGRFVPYLADTRFLERERDRNRKKKVSFLGKGRGTKKGTKDKKNLLAVVTSSRAWGLVRCRPGFLERGHEVSPFPRGR